MPQTSPHPEVAPGLSQCHPLLLSSLQLPCLDPFGTGVQAQEAPLALPDITDLCGEGPCQTEE